MGEPLPKNILLFSGGAKTVFIVMAFFPVLISRMMPLLQSVIRNWMRQCGDAGKRHGQCTLPLWWANFW